MGRSHRRAFAIVLLPVVCIMSPICCFSFVCCSFFSLHSAHWQRRECVVFHSLPGNKCTQKRRDSDNWTNKRNKKTRTAKDLVCDTSSSAPSHHWKKLHFPIYARTALSCYAGEAATKDEPTLADGRKEKQPLRRTNEMLSASKRKKMNEMKREPNENQTKHHLP